MPSDAELVTTPDERADPIGDHTHSPVKGIVHRYHDRVLLKPSHACPVYCRFCFRREMVGPGGEALSPVELEAALDYVRAHPEVWEVILTGGDPLILSPRRIGEIVREVEAIDHVGVIRVHTRVPVVDPLRVTDALIAALRAEKAIYVVLHVNHAREFTDAARAACRKLSDAGIVLLSQTVLLKGVNDDAATLEALFRALVRHRIKPYYLHQGDLAPGTSQFRTTIDRRSGADARSARPRLRFVPADLRPRHPRRARQGAGGAELSGRRRQRDRSAGQSSPAPLAAILFLIPADLIRGPTLNQHGRRRFMSGPRRVAMGPRIKSAGIKVFESCSRRVEPGLVVGGEVLH